MLGNQIHPGAQDSPIQVPAPPLFRAFRFPDGLMPACLLLLCACGGKDAGDRPHSAFPPLIHRFEAVPSVIEPGHTALLVMDFGPGHGEVDPGIGPVKSGHPVIISPVKDTTYTLTVRMPQEGAGWKARGAKEGGLKHVGLEGEGVRRSVLVKVSPPVPKVPGP